MATEGDAPDSGTHGSRHGHGMRRRASASLDRDEPAPTPSAEDTRSRTSAIDSTVRPAIARLTTDESPRVRFSTDIERDGTPHRRSMASARRSNDMAHAGRASGLGQPSEKPDLTVATQDVSRDGEAGSLGHELQPRSPLSPTSRNRGYSLRSVLFRKNVHDIANSPGANIELHEGVGQGARPRNMQAAGLNAYPPASKSEDLSLIHI